MKSYAILAMALLVLSVMPLVIATDTGAGIGVEITTKAFSPLIWMCDQRAWSDDTVQPNPSNFPARANNYAFSGESIHWKVLVMDKNKIEEVSEVVATIGDEQGIYGDKQVECTELSGGQTAIDPTCNARIGEEQLTEFNPAVMAYYDCRLTVEPNMQGPYWVTVRAESSNLDEEPATMDENENWFLNPEIGIDTEGSLTFSDVTPGTVSYSDTILVLNTAQPGSGVLLDMFVSGSDFYDSDSSGSGARCSDGTNKLSLDQFRYFATNGAFSTKNLAACTAGGNTRAAADVEGYVGIVRGGDGTVTGGDIHKSCEIIGNDAFLGTVNPGNVLIPETEMALTFKLTMPEPCVGNFNEGQIYFFGEAI